MEKYEKSISNGLSVIKNEEVLSTISVKDGNKTTIISSEKLITSDYWHRWASNDYYVVTYTRGCMANQLPLIVRGAYDIKRHKLIDVSDPKVSEALEFMLITMKGFGLDEVLTLINENELELIEYDKRDRLSNYLTSGNDNISYEDIVEYILKEYPDLSNYRNLKSLSVAEYRKIEGSTEGWFWFHCMPQDLSFMLDKESKVTGDTPVQKARTKE